jgi:hypothetical protein
LNSTHFAIHKHGTLLDTAKNSKIKRTAKVVPENPRGPVSFAARTPFTIAEGVLHPLLAMCAVLICIMAAGCHSSSSTTPVLTVTITAPTTSPTIEQGQSVNVTAAVANDVNSQGVKWSLSGIGAISNSTVIAVTYSAPISVTASTTVTITATSIANPNMLAVFSIHVTPPIAILISPATAVVPALGGQQGFTASVNYDENNAGVTWALSGTGCTGATCGTLTNVTTTSVSYQAPAAQPTPNTAFRYIDCRQVAIRNHFHHHYAFLTNRREHRGENIVHQRGWQFHPIHRDSAK